LKNRIGSYRISFSARGSHIGVKPTTHVVSNRGTLQSSRAKCP